MKKEYHILNGDTLKNRFPKDISGEIIVARECFVDGSVIGENLKELFRTRAEFISNNYKGYTAQDYYNNTVPEFKKMQSITAGAEVNLWFEDDLFCQVNFWFVINLLSKREASIFLIRPESLNQFGFGGLNKSALKSIYKRRVHLSRVGLLARLWHYYQKTEFEKLLETAKKLKDELPFILLAVKAHIARIPSANNLGQPAESLKQIMIELNTNNFEPVFKEFCKREYIYGFGDLQVRRLLVEIENRA